MGIEEFRNEQEDLEDIHRTLEDAGVSNLHPDDEVNLDMAEHEGMPPKRVSLKKEKHEKDRS